MLLFKTEGFTKSGRDNINEKEYESNILETIHENATANFKIGAISEERMREYDEMRLPPVLLLFSLSAKTKCYAIFTACICAFTHNSAALKACSCVIAFSVLLRQYAHMVPDTLQ